MFIGVVHYLPDSYMYGKSQGILNKRKKVHIANSNKALSINNESPCNHDHRRFYVYLIIKWVKLIPIVESLGLVLGEGVFLPAYVLE